MQIGVDIGTYTFNAIAQTITFSGVTITKIEQIKPIINGNANIDIFNPLTAGKFGTLSANVLTLDFNTSAQNNSDKLYICVNFADVELSTEATQLLVKGVLDTIKIDTNLISKEATQLLIKGVLDTIKTDTNLLVGKDFATQTTLLTRATEATLLLIKAKTDNLDVSLSSLNLEATQLLIKTAIDTLNLKDFATETTLLTRLSKTDFEARINTLGQKTSANSTPVVLASDQILNVLATFTESFIGSSGISKAKVKIEIGETFTIDSSSQLTYKDSITFFTNLGTIDNQGVLRFDSLDEFINEGTILNNNLIILD